MEKFETIDRSRGDLGFQKIKEKKFVFRFCMADMAMGLSEVLGALEKDLVRKNLTDEEAREVILFVAEHKLPIGGWNAPHEKWTYYDKDGKEVGVSKADMQKVLKNSAKT